MSYVIDVGGPRVRRSNNSRIQALDRGLAILDLLAGAGGPMAVGAISRELGLSPSTVSRLAATLRDRGLLAQESAGGAYSLGYELIRYARTAATDHPIGVAAAPVIEQLFRDVRETVSLSVPVEHGVLYVRSDAPVGRVVSIRVAPGTVLQYHATGSGKAILAYGSDELRCAVIARGLMPRTEATITDADALRADLEATRERGFAIDRGESDADVGCIAVPVFGRHGRPIAAVSCSMTVRSLSPGSVHHTGARLLRAARDIEASLAVPGTTPPSRDPPERVNGRA